MTESTAESTYFVLH